MKNAGTLFVVATPIGNLSDMTLRAIETLKSVDLIACEDTRFSKKLLDHFDIKKPTISYFQHSKLSKIDFLISELEAGKNIALVTDAGTPGISDPGQELIAEIRNSNIEILNKSQIQNSKYLNSHSERSEESSEQSERAPRQVGARSFAATQDDKESIKVIPIPGPSALTAAASVSGMIEKEFYFAGFLPKKKGRQTFFKTVKLLNCPIVIYESVNRLQRTLEDIRSYLGAESEVFIAREMTKMFEEYWGGKIGQVLADLKKHQLKGEIVLVVKRVSKGSQRG